MAPVSDSFVLMTPWFETDELTTRFHECLSCGFTRVPFYFEPDPDPRDVYESTARFCPGCGHPVRWTRVEGNED